MFNIFIINLNAGKKDGKLIGNIINEYLLTKSVFNYEIFYTETKEQTDIILNKYKNIYENINVYSIGGDGTLNSVINSIANTNMKLSVIPLGTGNDFYKSIENFDKDKIDLGKVNDKYFINVASIGIDAEIAGKIAEKLGYMNQEEKTSILNNCYEIGKMINGLLKSIK